jgi:hypothetical protein
LRLSTTTLKIQYMKEIINLYIKDKSYLFGS